MKKVGKKFMALLMVFASIISFLPAGFGGQAANAASDPTAVKVYITGNKIQLTSRIDSATQEEIYSTGIQEDTFDITVDDLRVATTPQLAQQKLISTAEVDEKSTTGIVDQELKIVSINGMKCETIAERDSLKSEIGIVISASNNPNSTVAKRLGERITGLPFGVNKVEYKITVSTQTIDCKPSVKDNTGKVTTPAVYTTNPAITETYSNQRLTIEHGTKYASSKISEMIFNAYIGKKSDLESTTFDNKNNALPFKYKTAATPDTNMPLRYTFDVPDSISILQYNMEFSSQLDLTNAKVYKNGVWGNSNNIITGQTVTGNLESLGQSDIILVKLDPTQGKDPNVQKAYAIEIRYNNLNADKDYSLKEAGITKLNYNNDSSVLAYVGKEFIVDNKNSFPTYNGEITIDKKATMISLDPTLIRSKNTLAYVVTNNYVDDNGTMQVKQSVLKNGKQFIDFMASSTSNKLQIDIYEGENGNKIGSTPLTRYYFKVNLLTGNDFDMALKFTNPSTGSTYLTQPGVKGNIIGSFTTDRRTYDLYTPDPVTIALTGARSNNHEYIRVWLGDDVNSNNLKEATESSENKFSNDASNPQDYLERETSLDINFGKAQKIVVQAYYDKFEYDSTGTIKTNSDGVPIYNSYSVGDKYVFYVPSNFTSIDSPTPGEKSDNADLSLLKIADGTLKDTDGNGGFSSDKFDYTVTVQKEDTSAKITATAQDDNIKSIVATIDGQEGAYDLVSGEVSELPLNTTGKTNIKLVVTAQDGTTSKTYTVLVNNNSKGSNVNLKNIILNVGDYNFDPTSDTTKVRVNQNVTSIKVTPITADSKATANVNGEEYSANEIRVSLKGTQKTEINIEVVSEDGKSSKTYTLEVYRVDVADWEDDSNTEDDANEDDQFYDEYNECWVDLTKYDEWGSVNGKPTYFDKKSRQVKDAWITTGGKNYYLNNLGYRASGWKIDDVNGKTYYLDPTTGEMKKGWMNLNNSWYYLNLNGVMQKGWLNLNRKWYYFIPNGQMVTNQSMFVDDKVYNFGQDGAIY